MEQLRRVVQGWLEMALTPLAVGLLRLGTSANQVSVGGLALNVATAGLVAIDYLVGAGVLYLIAGILDLLDGILARLTGTPKRFGAFLDSTIDRVSEGVVFAEGLGAECKVGIATRAERVVLVAVGLVTGLLTQAIYLLALLTAITVVQRVMRVRRELRTGH
jgi:CDP-diacylglycerol--glycerol-3-phosphate 3-phosphatidyltransferase